MHSTYFKKLIQNDIMGSGFPSRIARTYLCLLFSKSKPTPALNEQSLNEEYIMDFREHRVNGMNRNNIVLRSK